jgi:hypothetical protein
MVKRNIVDQQSKLNASAASEASQRQSVRPVGALLTRRIWSPHALIRVRRLIFIRRSPDELVFISHKEEPRRSYDLRGSV